MADSEAAEPKKGKPEKEPLFVQDQGQFTHETGDTYDGFFEAKKKDRSIKMQGPGTYTTAEGDAYTGVWEADKLGISEDATITFKDGSKYVGRLSSFCYNGAASYKYPDDSVLQGNFVENCPVGKLTLIDPNDHTWYGKAKEGFAWFQATNHYYEILEKVLPPKPKVKKPKPREPSEPKVEEVPIKKEKQVKLKNK